jgi:hypothetical protein
MARRARGRGRGLPEERRALGGSLRLGVGRREIGLRPDLPVAAVTSALMATEKAAPRV